MLVRTIQNAWTGLAAIALLATGCAHDGGGIAMSRSVEHTQLADRLAIEDLMARYMFALDWNDMEAYADMFTPDGEIEFASGTAKGREEIVQTVSAFKQRIGEIYTDPDGRPAKLRHFILEKAIRIEGDQAWARISWVEIAGTRPGGKPEVGTFGHYEDELLKRDGEWKFKRRRILNEFLEGRESGPVNPVREMDEAADAVAKSP